MSLIRNGGFERGNIDFWMVDSDGTLEITNSNQKYGAYCGKFTSAGNSSEVVLSQDYIGVQPYQIIDAAIWVKSGAVRTVYPVLYLYDADYSYIETVYGAGTNADGTYILYNSQFIIPSSCTYMRFGCRVQNSLVGEVFYLDGASVNILSSDSCKSGVAILLPMDAYIADGNTFYTQKDLKQFSTYYALLQCRHVSGTSPTLDVDVYVIDDFNESIKIGTFTQLTASGNERIDLPHIQGKQMHIVYKIAGSSPEFQFGVSVIGKG